jgi:Mg-chelatase subunit ChlD
MEASIIYSAVMAAILNALPAVTAYFVAFNTEVMDLSERVDDPLGLLLEISVGGGTDIGRGVRYARSLLRVPQRSIVVVVSDFEEGASVPKLAAEVEALVTSGAKVLGLAALDDRGAPRYNPGVAKRVADAGAKVAALTPLELAQWVGEQIR